MMPALTRRQRALVFAFSALGYLASSGALGAEVFAEQSEPDRSSFTESVPARALPVGLAIRRDPFASPPLPPPAQPLLGLADQVVPDIADVPPDVGAPRDAAARAQTQTLVLKATIAGANPVAYVQDGTNLDIVRIGSRLGDRSITSIDLHGVKLDDGTELELTDHDRGRTSATPARTAPGTIDELRRLLLQALRRRDAPPAGLASPASPPLASSSAAPLSSPSPFATFPPPGPLPTIVPDFLPVGVSPTSDPNGPTPYPLPPLRPN